MKYSKLILPFGFLLIIGLGLVSYMLTEDVEISEMENRTLALVPNEPTSEEILSGEWSKQVETYMSDQFLARDVWLKSFVLFQLATKKTYMNDAYYADLSTGVITSRPVELVSEAELEKGSNLVVKIKEQLEEDNIPLTFFSIPAKATYIREPHPEFMPEDQGLQNNNRFLEKLAKKGIDQVKLMDTMEELTDSDLNVHELFFKTDHHWNMEGAFLGYQAIISEMANRLYSKPTLLTKANTELTCVEMPFSGSWNKQYYLLVPNDDQVCYQEPINFDEQFETYLGEIKPENEAPRNEVYGHNSENVSEDIIGYATGYSFDYGEINILNKKYDWDMHVVVFKDSYFNAIQYHVANHFKRTTVIDVRHFDKDLEAYLTELNPDYVIMTYNDRNFDLGF